MRSKSTRILSIILVVAMIFSIIPAVSAYSGVSSWAEDKVAAMDELGLIPESLANSNLSNNISRLDMCRMAVLAYTKVTGKTIEVPSSHPFSDTTDPDVERAYSIGLVSGDGNGKFRPNDALKRVEFFCIVNTFLKIVGYPVNEQSKADLTSFSDASTLPKWGYEAAQIMVSLSVVVGTGGALSWNKYTSSEEAIAMFYRAYNLSTNTPVPPPPEETTPPASDFINLADWAKDSVYKMSDLGLIPDEVRSTPMNGSITRTNMCKVIMLAYKQLMGVTDSDLASPDSNPFSDTSDPDVLHAYSLGIVNGKGNGIFGANDPITRQDFFVVTAKFLNSVGYNRTDDQSVDLSAFHDSGKLADYAVSSARLLIGIGALAGDSNRNLNPQGKIVSQEALCVFYKVHSFISNWDGSSSNDNRPDASKAKAAAVVEFAKKYEGYDYAYGGKDPETGFDCSGFVYFVYKNFGYNLLPGALSQWEILDTNVDRNALLLGDLVFFSEDGTPDGMSHVGIYIGNDEIIHASTPSTGVIISSLSEPYYERMYLGAKRAIN